MYDIEPRNRSNPYLIENFGMSNLVINRYIHRDRVTAIDIREKEEICDAILAAVKISVGEEINEQELLVLASYPLVDVLNPNISPRCNWMVIRDTNGKVVGVVLDYFGENNYRYFCYGDTDVIKLFLTTFPKTNGIATHPDDFRIVIPTWQIKRDELGNLLDSYWQLRDKPEIVTRVYNPLSEYELLSITLDHNFEVIDLQERHHSSILSLLENYQHHSYKSPEGHIGVIDKNTDEVLAMSGILAQAQRVGFLPISLSGNLVTRKGYEGKGLALAARAATLNKIKLMDLYNQGIVVSDANEKSLPLNQKLGYRTIRINSGLATFWWCIYRR